jgi:hypothetical protein
MVTQPADCAGNNDRNIVEKVQENLQHLQETIAAIVNGTRIPRPRVTKVTKRRRAMRTKKIKDYTHAVYKIWHRCYLDRKDFGHTKLLLTQRDVESLCQAQQLAPHSGLYVVPRQPRQPLSRGNALLVDKVQRRFLLALWRMTRDEDEYLYSVEALKPLAL